MAESFLADNLMGLSDQERLLRALMTPQHSYAGMGNGASIAGGGSYAQGIAGGGGELGVGFPLTDYLSMVGSISGGGAAGTTPGGYRVRAVSPGEGYLGLRYRKDF